MDTKREMDASMKDNEYLFVWVINARSSFRLMWYKFMYKILKNNNFHAEKGVWIKVLDLEKGWMDVTSFIVCLKT